MQLLGRDVSGELGGLLPDVFRLLLVGQRGIAQRRGHDLDEPLLQPFAERRPVAQALELALELGAELVQAEDRLAPVGSACSDFQTSWRP